MEDIIQRFYSDLVDVLPMNDAGFRAKLFSAGLLSGNLKSQIKSLPTSADKAECFLDDGINNDSTSFQKLVAVMERYSIENVKKLANHIKRVIQTHQSVSAKPQQKISNRKRKLSTETEGEDLDEFKPAVKHSDSDANGDEIDYYDKMFSGSDLDNLFVQLLDQLQLLWDNMNTFQRIKAACERTNKLPADIKRQIRDMHSLEEIITLLCNNHYCSWFEIRVLCLMAHVAENSKANRLIEAFTQSVHTRKAVEVEAFFTERYIGSVFSFLVTLKINKCGKNMSVKELLKCCQDAENFLTAIRDDDSIPPIVDIKLGKCIEVSVVLPLRYCYHAYNVYMNNFLKLRQCHIRYVQVESYPKIFAMKFSTLQNSLSLLEDVSSSNTHTLKLSPSQVISHYYTYLEDHMDADSVSHVMYCRHLLTDDDYHVISTAPNDMKMNCLLLQYVKLMNVVKLLKFCNVLKELETQKKIGDSLEASIKEVIQFSSLDASLAKDNNFRRYHLPKIKWSTRIDISNIHFEFFDLVDLLILQLSATDVLAFSVADECRSLMASNVHNIPYFNKTFLSRLNNINCYFLLKIILLPFMSWLDHSILRTLVLSSQSEVATRLLEQFNSLIDYTQPITSYPIPSPSQLMIPPDDSDYTLVATKCDCDLEEVTLQRIVDMKTLLVEKWEITEHALQLMVVHVTQRILYWMIPKCLVTVIKDKIVDTAQHELWHNGIIMISIFQTKNIETISKKFNLFCLLVKNECQNTSSHGETLDIDHNVFTQVNPLRSVAVEQSQQYNKLSQQFDMVKQQFQEERSSFEALERFRKNDLDKTKNEMETLMTTHQKLKDDYEIAKQSQQHYEESQKHLLAVQSQQYDNLLQQYKDLSKESDELQIKKSQLQDEKNEFEALAKVRENDINKMKIELSELTDNYQILKKDYEAQVKARGHYLSYLRQKDSVYPIIFYECVLYGWIQDHSKRPSAEKVNTLLQNFPSSFVNKYTMENYSFIPTITVVFTNGKQCLWAVTEFPVKQQDDPHIQLKIELSVIEQDHPSGLKFTTVEELPSSIDDKICMCQLHTSVVVGYADQLAIYDASRNTLITPYHQAVCARCTCDLWCLEVYPNNCAAIFAGQSYGNVHLLSLEDNQRPYNWVKYCYELRGEVLETMKAYWCETHVELWCSTGPDLIEILLFPVDVAECDHMQIQDNIISLPLTTTGLVVAIECCVVEDHLLVFTMAEQTSVVTCWDGHSKELIKNICLSEIVTCIRVVEPNLYIGTESGDCMSVELHSVTYDQHHINVVPHSPLERYVHCGPVQALLAAYGTLGCQGNLIRVFSSPEGEDHHGNEFRQEVACSLVLSIGRGFSSPWRSSQKYVEKNTGGPDKEEEEEMDNNLCVLIHLV